MTYSRRNIFRLFGTSLIGGIAGCTSLTHESQQGHVPIVLENNHKTPHMISISITSTPDGELGFTEYFSGTWLVDSGDEHTFEEGIPFTDYEPELMGLIILENETAKRVNFSFNNNMTELRVLISEQGKIEIQPRE